MPYNVSEPLFQEFDSDHLDHIAKEYGTERRLMESDSELRKRINDRMSRFRNRGSFYDIVNLVEIAIYNETPVFCDHNMIRQQVGIHLVKKNRPEKLLERIKLAVRSFWIILT